MNATDTATQLPDDFITVVPLFARPALSDAAQAAAASERFDGDRVERHEGRYFPVVHANRSASGQLFFFCRYCDCWHWHGGGDHPGDGDGHRVAHCLTDDSPYRDTGYLLRETPHAVVPPAKRYRRIVSGSRLLSGFLAAKRAASQKGG